MALNAEGNGPGAECRRWAPRLAVLLAPMMLACGRSGLEALPTRVRVEVLLTSIGVYNTLHVEWHGHWLSSAPGTPTGGAEVAGTSLELPPAGQTPVIGFPESEALRPGVWSITTRMVGSGTDVLLYTSCEVELFYGTRVVRFTEGFDLCAPAAGGSLP